ncbi:substrate-binding domain-containing protein, partial [Phytoactinopolyspora endophytica]|uniref:substrate-binding domain-containing protein n=1 Tax=Phytoactinopolyspora endophytica TaxID=1642495 RepID=UPI0013EBED29
AQHRVALVGFDDVELADLISPGLTVIAQNPVAVGRRAAQLLLAQLANTPGELHGERIPTTLIPRGSGELPGPHHDTREAAQDIGIEDLQAATPRLGLHPEAVTPFGTAAGLPEPGDGVTPRPQKSSPRSVSTIWALNDH